MVVPTRGSWTRHAVLAGLAIAVAVLPTRGFAQVPPAVEAALKQMLEAVKIASYSQFVAPGDPRFLSGFTTKMFEDLNKRLAPRLKKGYSTSYLGQLHQRGYAVYVWKLTFEDGGDDVLLTVFAAGDKVSGFIPR
jgi:hypothetical protein